VESHTKVIFIMNETLNLANIPEHDRLPFYGALFAIGTADGQLDQDEMELIFGLMDLEGMSESGQRQVQSYVINPPSLWECLKKLSQADEQLRYGLMINLVDTAWANDQVDSEEKKALSLAQRELRVTDEQRVAIETFIGKVREIRERGIDDYYAEDAVKTAATGLDAVGVPLSAVWFSGSVIGFSTAGLTSGLTALGKFVSIGGMIPGIDVVVLAGLGIFMGINWLLDPGDTRKKEELKREKERKAQLVIQNMQGAINELVSQIAHLQEQANNLEANATAQKNQEAIRVLTERLKFMEQSVSRRKQVLEAT
jgi:uncharacterized tellurite resistance protein B-like protein